MTLEKKSFSIRGGSLNHKREKETRRNSLNVSASSEAQAYSIKKAKKRK